MTVEQDTKYVTLSFHGHGVLDFFRDSYCSSDQVNGKKEIINHKYGHLLLKNYKSVDICCFLYFV